MRTFLRLVGGIWAVIGVLNIFNSPSMNSTGPNYSGAVAGFVLLFNICLFIGPGLMMAGVGSIIKKSQPEKKCPRCAEMIKVDAKICRFCNTDLD